MQRYIHTQTDEYGDIAVIDEDDKRILSFGVGDEQSVQLKSQPHMLQHAYTQAMLASLLFCEPKRVLLLGLGAGSLLNALHYHVPGVKIEAVELRQAVIDIANKYFRLANSKKINLHCASAMQFLQAGITKKVDLIMTDLYDDNGMDEVQVSAEYIQLSADCLKVNGWLVINCWGAEEDHGALLTQLQRLFSDVRSCESGDGNLVIFAGKQKDLKSRPDLKTHAVKYSQKFGFDLQRFVSKME